MTLRAVKRGTAKKPAGPTICGYHMGPATAAHLAFCEAWATECSARDARDTRSPTWPDAYVIAIRYSNLIRECKSLLFMENACNVDRRNRWCHFSNTAFRSSKGELAIA